MTIPNPKLIDTNTWDCIPQAGKCPIDCNQCFFNREGAFYTETPSVPTVEEVGDSIVRMNCGNDSNNDRRLVIKTALQYKHFFFNTSIPVFDFPGPVVFTANACEEKPATTPGVVDVPPNLMFVRLRVTTTNLALVKQATHRWTKAGVPVVLTFLAYYDKQPEVPKDFPLLGEECYVWKVRHINSYWCPTPVFMRYAMNYVRGTSRPNRFVSMCGGYNDSYCHSCRNCESYY
jgi:hypothetical protein